MKSNRPILLVEDDDVDAMTVKRAFKEINVTNSLIRTENGEEALRYLLDEEKEEPCLIMLDINMPIMNGIEFLIEREKHERLKRIRTIVLTTSKHEQDKMNAFGLNISGYMIKPVDFPQFVDLMKVVNLYFTLSESA